MREGRRTWMGVLLAPVIGPCVVFAGLVLSGVIRPSEGDAPGLLFMTLIIGVPLSFFVCAVAGWGLLAALRRSGRLGAGWFVVGAGGVGALTLTLALGLYDRTYWPDPATVAWLLLTGTLAGVATGWVYWMLARPERGGGGAPSGTE